MATCKLPREKNPTRVVLSADEYQQLLAVSHRIGWRFHVALVLAHETGHRIGAVRKLRWEHLDLDGQRVRWVAESDKTGHEHTTPLTDKAVSALLEARLHNPWIGDVPVLPAPVDPAHPVSRDRVVKWWKRAEDEAGLKPMRGRGWHSLRRKFATDLRHEPLKTICQLGGWQSHHTVVECYQQVDEGALREALSKRRAAGGTP